LVVFVSGVILLQGEDLQGVAVSLLLLGGVLVTAGLLTIVMVVGIHFTVMGM
jgi:hypothetical protein